MSTIFLTLIVSVILLGYVIYRGIAQLVEHWSPKPGVVGSSPATPATKIRSAFVGRIFVYVYLRTRTVRRVLPAAV